MSYNKSNNWGFGRPDWDPDGYDKIEPHYYAIEWDRQRIANGHNEWEDELDRIEMDWDRDR